MKTAKLLVSFVLILGLFAEQAVAETILLTYDGTGSGSIDGTAFTDADFTISAFAETSNVQPFTDGMGFSVDHDFAQIEILGLGQLDFLTQTRSFVNNDTSTAGFSLASLIGPDLLSVPFDSAFSTWDLTTDIGLIQGPGFGLLQWATTDVLTDAGILFFETATFSGEFSAIEIIAEEVPEPSTGVVSLMIACVIGARRRRN